jgi:3-oxoadipate enol-lactonase/4-carboxymuconolactone decarboxylase
MLDEPHRVAGAVLLCTGARLGTAESWADRVAQVQAGGTASLTEASAKRWFAPGFLDRHPDAGSALLQALQQVDDVGYAQVCEALAGFDVRDRLAEVKAPVLAVTGEHDPIAPPEVMGAVADGVPDGRLVVLPDVSHLAPAEAPAVVAQLVRSHLLGEPEPDPAQQSRYDAGLAVRREVLGDAHVDRALAGTTDFTGAYQELITEYAWGSVWTRPGLDRRSRSLITLTALVAGGHHEELAMHVRAGLRNGLTVVEIQECLLQTAVYCGVPAANTAFRIAQQVLASEGDS